MLIDLVSFIVGFVMLLYGAHVLVNGASGLARRLGLSPIVIGLTIVAFGTSTPELVVSLLSSLSGKSMIAIGNVIGSNICNITLVLGVSAAITPIRGNPSVCRRDIPLMLIVSLYLFLISYNGVIGRVEGATMVLGLIAYTWYNYTAVTIGSTGDAEETGIPVTVPASVLGTGSRWKLIVQIVLGIAGVVIGAELLIRAAVHLMALLGVSEKFVGLTVVAFGTSLPELATSAVAAHHGESDISIGNLLGSNVFNILSVLGISALVRPIPIPGGFIHSGLVIDYGVMMATSALPWLLMRRDDRLSRGGGLILVSCYIAYLLYLIRMA
jgi:cation:H+ antiporter